MSSQMLLSILHVLIFFCSLGRCSASSTDETTTLGDASGTAPHTIIPLQRESIPVVKNGKTVSYKTAYHGKISIGGGSNQDQRQQFSVVFDTGSGHVVIPSKDCKDDTCLKHRHYDIATSPNAIPINADGSLVPDDELCDQVTIGYGTGTVVGELVRETVCLGHNAGSGAFLGARDQNRLCSKVSIVMAVEMSAEPFNSFRFDGVFGLGLNSLALAPEFSFVGRMGADSAKAGALPQFAVFLSDTQDGEDSEIAFGGHNADRLEGPLSWSPVTMPKLGYWQVKIAAIRIGGTEFEACKKGKCRAIVDTGTSHVGVPDQFADTFGDLLTSLATTASDDCRQATAPNVTIVINNFTIELRPEDYMRPQPLMKKWDSRKAIAAPQTKDSSLLPMCTPRIMPVSLKAPLGPNLFILGEPVLRRYYTVFDRAGPSIGFGLAKQKKKAVVSVTASMEAVVPEALEPLEPLEGDEEHSAGEQIFLMQVTLTVEMEEF